MGQYYPVLASYRLLLRSLPVCFASCCTVVVGDVVAPVVELAAAMAEIIMAMAELLTARPRVN